MKTPFFALAALLAVNAFAVPVSVRDPAGKPLATVMVSRVPVSPAAVDKSDNGYAASGKPQQAFFELARFTDAAGATDELDRVGRRSRGRDDRQRARLLHARVARHVVETKVDLRLRDLPRRLDGRPRAAPVLRRGHATPGSSREARIAQKHRLPQPALVRVLRQLQGRLGQGDLDERSTAVGELLSSLAVFADWPGALSFLRQLPAERSQPVDQSVLEIKRLLRALEQHGKDLYQGLRALSVAQATSDDNHTGSLREVVSAAVRTLS